VKVLILDNNIDPPYGCSDIRALLDKNSAKLGEIQIESFRAPDFSFPKNVKDWDAVILSGSKTRIFENAPWIDQEMKILRDLHREKIPTLGICYGEQLMARVFAGDKTAGAAKTAEFGWTEIEMLPAAKKSAVFKSLPKKFHSFSFHSDEVYPDLPENFRVTAKSESCAVQAFDLTDAPMWGVQFHPERNLEEGNRGLDSRKKREPNTEILNRNFGEKVFDKKIADTVFGNFLKIVFKESA
jgi:GMP synthase (glutamine-hydrolysing)